MAPPARFTEERTRLTSKPRDGCWRSAPSTPARTRCDPEAQSPGGGRSARRKPVPPPPIVRSNRAVGRGDDTAQGRWTSVPARRARPLDGDVTRTLCRENRSRSTRRLARPAPHAVSRAAPALPSIYSRSRTWDRLRLGRGPPIRGTPVRGPLWLRAEPQVVPAPAPPPDDMHLVAGDEARQTVVGTISNELPDTWSMFRSPSSWFQMSWSQAAMLSFKVFFPEYAIWCFRSPSGPERHQATTTTACPKPPRDDDLVKLPTHKAKTRCYNEVRSASS